MQVLGKYKVDAAVILDESKRVCARFTPHIGQDVYWFWRCRYYERRNMVAYLPDLREKYQASYPPPLFPMETIAEEVRSGTNTATFSNFNCLSYPLKECSGLGLSKCGGVGVWGYTHGCV